MGRLPWMEHQMTKLSKSGAAGGDDGNPGSKFDSPLQPACLVLLTDGECLSLPPEEGGGNLTLRFGNMPLRDFYREREYGQEEVNHSSFLYVFGSVFHFVTTQTPFRLLLLH
jgi:hypothetical protein